MRGNSFGAAPLLDPVPRCSQKGEAYLEEVHLIHGFSQNYVVYHPVTPRSFRTETAARSISKMCTGTQPARCRCLPPSPGGITLLQCRSLKALRHADAKL